MNADSRPVTGPVTDQDAMSVAQAEPSALANAGGQLGQNGPEASPRLTCEHHYVAQGVRHPVVAWARTCQFCGDIQLLDRQVDAPPPGNLAERFTRVLAENCINADAQVSQFHDWRCEYPQQYGARDCLATLVAELVAAVGTLAGSETAQNGTEA